MLSFFSSRRNWDSPNPSPAGDCAPPPVLGGGAHSLGWESPNSDEGTYTVVLFIYSYFVVGSLASHWLQTADKTQRLLWSLEYNLYLSIKKSMMCAVRSRSFKEEGTVMEYQNKKPCCIVLYFVCLRSPGIDSN